MSELLTFTIPTGSIEVKIPFKVKVISTNMNLHNVDYKNSVVVGQEKGKLTICNLAPGDLIITCKKASWWNF
jgi:hypothetical protein